MSHSLITKDDNIKTTPVYIGYLILKILKKDPEGKKSIFEIVEKLKKDLKVIHARQVTLALMFLFSTGLVGFTAPYVYKV